MIDPRYFVKSAFQTKFGIAPELIIDSANLYTDLHLIINDIAEFVDDCEDVYEIFIPNAAVDKLNTVGDLINLLRSKTLC